MHRRTVVFPQPDGPSNVTNSPARIERETSWTATVSAKRLVKERNSIMNQKDLNAKTPKTPRKQERLCPSPTNLAFLATWRSTVFSDHQRAQLGHLLDGKPHAFPPLAAVLHA